MDDPRDSMTPTDIRYIYIKYIDDYPHFPDDLGVKPLVKELVLKQLQFINQMVGTIELIVRRVEQGDKKIQLK